MSRAIQAKNSTAAQTLGRAGMVCYGVIHVLIGYLALRVAFGDGGEQADQRGALTEIGSGGFGKLVLWVLAVGLFAYAAWQALMAAKGFHWVLKRRERTVKRVAAVARAVIGVVLGVTAVRLASGNGSGGSGDQQQRSWTAQLLALPAGRVLVGVVAMVVIGIAVALVVKGVRESFLDDLDTTALPTGSRRWVTRLGIAGYLAKGVVLGIVGVLIGIAALHRNAGRSGGLDAALRTVAGQPFGTAALVAVALGLAAYGVFCFAAAKAHRT
ncbi:DUF1206 domain-containing protein [Actinophytocola gossypii]|uniref:DUF1206 domain-containing protein n=1 Tax=Actinophytocola gossypii TaxID=2812003 RepID=A0ABT2JB30_9PSEU|nr:DUF1206 domain-containing protein [Actinophytocola gossypii]MCT2585057.1 DUF1206 domain-containing protein [Actinophytocola gossypii]